MKPKKNPKSDLSRRSGLYFSIGLCIVMGLTYATIEWKTYDKEDSVYIVTDVDEGLDEDVPVLQMVAPPPPPPPPPPPAPVAIEVVEDEAEIEEAPIQSTDVDQEEVMEIDDVEVIEEPVDVEVPFAVIEDVPVFPGCERKKKNKEKLRACFNEQMQKHIRKYFKYPEIAKEMGVQGRVSIRFTIGKDGSITDIMARGPDKSLEKEAIRIISKLPKMTPGKQRGKPVKVPFSIPIIFRLQ